MVFIGENYLIKDLFSTKELTDHDIIYSVKLNDLDLLWCHRAG